MPDTRCTNTTVIDAQMCTCSHRRAAHAYAPKTGDEVTGIGLGACGASWPDDPADVQGHWSECGCRGFEEAA